MTKKANYSILIVDDDDYVLKSLSRVLRTEDYDISCFHDAEEALMQCGLREYDLILSDQRMPGLLGTDFFRQIMQFYPYTRRILISGYTDFSSVTEAFNDGIISKFLVKPWDNQLLKDLIRSELKERDKQLSQLQNPESINLNQSKVSFEFDDIGSLQNYYGILTSDQALLQQISVIQRTANSDAPFYINGETGTGKELFARAIHSESDRKDGPFIALNCANLTETLLESQLFGHTKGAFTGAQKDQVGLLSAADGGSLFLDEVTEIPLALQAKLLRVLQEREYTPIGKTQPVSFDVKVISASALSLEKAVELGLFREDLRFRLEVMPITLPPLRARKQDIKELFEYFLLKQFARHGIDSINADQNVYDSIMDYHWPGNVRELENVCTYVAALSSDNSSIGLVNLPATLHKAGSAPIKSSKSKPVSPTTRQDVLKLDQESLAAAIREHDGHRDTIAEKFGISRMTLWRKMKQYELLENE